ncbi:hypothetical protein CO111_06185 [Candidatus Desantisbacteria bacterium CG_4_9_14_3_um_filter_50_7]|nr:MAG: hypothetical protein CO111_06185 [Candidatus Desantisbacteria bacterium CG_4_9_14_3_um_filter_50_7]
MNKKSVEKKFKEFEPHKYMKMAVKVMKKSIQEPRSDKKSPKVGAVLLMPDGSIDTGFRGELRQGDHAEFTVLDKKHEKADLTGSYLFATLEPCAPGSRGPGRVCCAERIVSARIKKMWIGIEDPDPMVDRKGIKCLQDAGIKVKMFDQDLQKIIEKENLEFIKQARERAENADKNTSFVLSDFEKANKKASLSDFSNEALEFYKKETNFKGTIVSKDFFNKLYHKGLVDKIAGKYIPTGIGLILFGKNPEDFYSQVTLKGTITYPDRRVGIKDFKGPLVLVPKAFEEWWYSVLRTSIDRSSSQRSSRTDFPYKPIREALVNALAHRDYDCKLALCHVEINEHTIIVKSPGRPVAPISLEQMQNFNAPYLSRNPQIFSVFDELNLVEGRGLGMNTYRSLPQEYNIPFPYFSFKEPFLDLIFYRSSKDIPPLTDKKILDQLNSDEIRGVEHVFIVWQISKNDYAEHFNYNNRKAERHLEHFHKLGIINMLGAGPSTVYMANRAFPFSE